MTSGFSAAVGAVTATGDAGPVDDADASQTATATFGDRFTAWMIDAAALFALQWVAVVVISRQLQSAGMVSAEPCTPDSPFLCEGPSTGLWAVLFALVVGSTFGVHAWFDGHVGATPGKRLMGLSVRGTNDDGSHVGRPATIGFGRGLVRSIVRQGWWLWLFLFVDASPLAITVPGVVWLGLLGVALATFVVGAFAPSGRALHDRLASSAVVAVEHEPASHHMRPPLSDPSEEPHDV